MKFSGKRRRSFSRMACLIRIALPARIVEKILWVNKRGESHLTSKFSSLPIAMAAISASRLMACRSPQVSTLKNKTTPKTTGSGSLKAR